MSAKWPGTGERSERKTRSFMTISKYLLAIFISLSPFAVEAGMVRGYVNKKGRYTKPHFRKSVIRIRKIK